MKRLVDVIDPDTGEVIDTHDQNESCGGPLSNGYCGGCGMCLLMQAAHYGFKLEYSKDD